METPDKSTLYIAFIWAFPIKINPIKDRSLFLHTPMHIVWQQRFSYLSFLLQWLSHNDWSKWIPSQKQIWPRLLAAFTIHTAISPLACPSTMTMKSTQCDKHLSTTNLTTHENDTFTLDPGITCLFPSWRNSDDTKHGRKQTHNRRTSVTNMQDLYSEFVQEVFGGDADKQTIKDDKSSNTLIIKPNWYLNSCVSFQRILKGSSCM